MAVGQFIQLTLDLDQAPPVTISSPGADVTLTAGAPAVTVQADAPTVTIGVPGMPGATGPVGPTGPTGAASTVPGPAGPTGPSGPPAGTTTELQYRANSANLGAVPGSSVTGNTVKLTTVDGTGAVQRALSLTGDQPRLHIQGDGTDHFTDGTNLMGISFGGNYYFGIGANIDTLASAAILVQANGSVLIPNITFGYVSPIGGSTADSFGRYEGQKMRLKFGTDNEHGVRVHDGQAAGHNYLSTMIVESASTVVPVLIAKGRAGQAGALIDAQDSTGVSKFKVAADGAVTAKGAPLNPWVQMTQAAYDALGTKDPNTLYVIVG